MSNSPTKDRPFTYYRSPRYWFGLVTVLFAFGLALWPVEPGELTARVLTISGLLLTSGTALYHDMETRSPLARRQWWSNYLFMWGVIFLPLRGGAKLPWYVAGVSIVCLLAAIYLGWRVHQEKKRATREMPVPPGE
ncbi:hypothetical protein [Lewinella sp. IMCC34183]|uniref:hypothetical protein n=1 Tax=Lewinella sp. IMCC34183 TaxID=2248762 RepID=UPI000E2866C4|nr:hypothetical protein [Lewinella sp. IMCC34183]